MKLAVSALSAALALSLVPLPAHAILRDHGPVIPRSGNPVPGMDGASHYPAWYRDTNGVALEPCLTQTPSPNAAAAGAPMCFPFTPDPAAFPGNFADEGFYFVAGSSVTTATGNALLDLALEMAYVNGAPVHGDEMVFARVRIRVDVPAAGTYVVHHPYGTHVFPDVTVADGINFTSDIGVGPLLFDGALKGAIGPFLEWERPLLPGETLDILDNAGNVVESYLGDPNLEHTIQGSPLGVNYFRVEGPGIGGPGIDFVESRLFTIVGKRYLKPIPTPMTVSRASYARDAKRAQLDVFVSSAPDAVLTATGAGMPAVQLKGDGNGNFYGHYETNPTSLLPASVLVTNSSDAPPSSATKDVTDLVSILFATYDPAAGTLTVGAASSDASDGAPLLSLLGHGAMTPVAGTPGAAELVVPVVIPPFDVTVISSAFGAATAPVAVVSSGVSLAQPPIAGDDVCDTIENAAVPCVVASNDQAIAAGATLAKVRLLQAPAHGAVQVDSADPLVLVYTPARNYFGPDAFTYAVEDSLGAISNAATVTVDVAYQAIPPATQADVASTRLGQPIVLELLKNDAAVNGTLDPATVTLATPPAFGTATIDAAGRLTYTPVATTPAAGDVFTYTVADSFGVVSAATQVRVTVTGTTDVVTVIRAQYEVRKARWRVDGTSNIFGNGIVSSVSIYNGLTESTGTLLATVPIDATGAFTWQSDIGAVAPDASRTVTVVSTGGGRTTARVTLK